MYKGVGKRDASGLMKMVHIKDHGWNMSRYLPWLGKRIVQLD